MSDDQQLTIAERDAAARAVEDAAKQRMRRLLLLADRLSAEATKQRQQFGGLAVRAELITSDLCAEAAREIKQLCEWIRE